MARWHLLLVNTANLLAKPQRQNGCLWMRRQCVGGCPRDDGDDAIGAGLRVGAGRGEGTGIFARMASSAACSSVFARTSPNCRSTACCSAAICASICCSCCGSGDEAAGAFGATISGAVWATGSTGGLVQPRCWTQLAILCLASGDQPSLGALVAIIWLCCLAVR